MGPPEVYGQDRVFVYARLDYGPDPAQDAAIDVLEKADQPVVRIAIAEAIDLGEEFFRWEIATAVAGSIIGINATANSTHASAFSTPNPAEVSISRDGRSSVRPIAAAVAT